MITKIQYLIDYVKNTWRLKDELALIDVLNSLPNEVIDRILNEYKAPCPTCGKT